MNLDLRNAALELLARAAFPLAAGEEQKLTVIDFGLCNQPEEGAQFIDLFRTQRMRISVMALLPNQTLPEHCHPPYGGEPGKEENVRVLFGEFRVYLPGAGMREGFLVKGKEKFYTARREVVLRPGDSLTIAPGVDHWFQAGPEGSVTLGCYTAADESRNRFTDPGVSSVGTFKIANRNHPGGELQ